MDRQVTSDKADPEEEIGSAYEAVVLSSSGEAVNIDPYRTLINADTELRSTLSFQEVLTAIAQRSQYSNSTALSFYQQWWDTNNDPSRARVSAPHALHCDPPPDPYNMVCPRQEGMLAGSEFTPFDATNDRHGYSLLAAVNRFDLAPADGSNCGEYRLIFGKNSGKTRANDRLLVSFEALLPNPNPSAGIAACKPLAQFWVDLSLIENASQRAAAVKSFFFNGLPGFEAPIHPKHYGINGGAIRTNQFMLQFMAQLWQLREYKTEYWCPQGAQYQSYCTLRVKNVPVDNHPNPDFFSSESTDPQRGPARAEFLANMQSLLAPTLGDIRLVNSPSFNPINSDGFLKRSDVAFRVGNDPAFQAQITARLAELGETTLTWQHVTNRASTQLCAGCHQAANSKPLGNGLTWPPSNTFTHIDESRTEAVVDDVGQVIGTRPLLSPAMKTLFLPDRKQALERYFAAHQ